MRPLICACLLFAAAGFAKVAAGLPPVLSVTDALVLRLESDAGLQRQGDVVHSWGDGSPSQNTVFATGAPIWLAEATPSGRPAIQLDGIDDRFERLQATHPLIGFPTGGSPRTLFVVVRYHTAAVTGGMVYGTANANRMFGLGLKATSGELLLLAHASANNHLGSSTVGAGAGWLIQTGLLSEGQLSLFKDGVPLASSKANLNTTLGRLVIGQDLAQTGFVRCDVAAVLLYARALGGEERREVEAYLTSKYITPVDNTAPVVAILTPPDGTVYFPGDVVRLAATAVDEQEGDLSEEVVWDSDVDERLGQGATLEVRELSTGPHVITASVVDGGGLTGVDSVAVTIRALANTPPLLTVMSPADGAVFTAGERVWFSAEARDEEEGDLSSRVVWTSSREGWLGTGAGVETRALSLGTHQVDAAVEDSAGARAVVRLTLTINPPPNAVPQVDILAPAAGTTVVYGQAVELRGSAQDEEDGSLSDSIVWTSDRDGPLGTGSSVTSSRLTVGTHEISATVLDQGGATGVATVTLIVEALENQPPQISILSPNADEDFFVDEDITFTASVSDAEDGSEPLGSTVRWESDRDGALGVGASLIRTLSTGRHRVVAHVTDSGGLSASAEVSVTVRAVAELVTEGLVLHLDAAVGVQESAGGVVGWADQSGRANHFSAVGRPTVERAVTPSGAPALRVRPADALERNHATDPLAGFPTGTADRTLVAVVRYHRANRSTGVTYGTAADNQAFGIVADGDSGNLAWQAFGLGNDWVVPVPAVGAGWLVQTARLRDDTAELFLEETSLGSRTHRHDTRLTRSTIGGSIEGQDGGDLDVVVVLLYDRALTDREQLSVLGFLQHRLLHGEDVDEDGLADAWELAHFGDLTQAAEADSDGDGLANGLEFQLGLNPAAPDSDRDGMPDGWEHRYGLNPYADDAGEDADGDGVSNRDEFRLGRSPRAGVYAAGAAELQLRVFQPLN